MRIQYKGGVWKNSEDEILKAAVMKYGKNQWPRIASLLVRKSAKQCKSRWFEWLDPSIKKTEWTQEEEEKLIHLQRIMPTAWRTIAPMIGRTASQCIEHFEALVNRQSTEPAADGDAAGSSVTPRMRAGEPESVPESKPARPDPVDMDEDELEMLSEARARLANTKGKKAKRKAREKQLEAAKLVAQLQKSRELKAAGVPLRRRRENKKVMDYATEIPFMRTTTAGFYDTREEDERAAAETGQRKQIGKLLQKYKGKTALEKEEEERAKDRVKRRKLEEQNPLASLGLDLSDVPRSPPLNRTKLVLPKPQLSDLELEKLAKNGKFTPTAQQSMSSAGGTGPTLHAAGSSSAKPPLPDNGSASRPGGELWEDIRDRRVQDILNIQSAGPALRGGADVSVDTLGLDGKVTPALSQLQTPNPLATPSLPSDVPEAVPMARRRKRSRNALSELGEMVRKRLAALPEPENDYELNVGDDVDEDDEDATDAEGDMIEDAEEELRQREREERARVPILQEKLLSSAAKRNLPLPEVVAPVTNIESERYLMQRDHTVLRIIKEFDSGTLKPYEAINELKSLKGSDAADKEDLMEKARKMVNDQMKKDAEAGLDLEREIFMNLQKAEIGIVADLSGMQSSDDGDGEKTDENLALKRHIDQCKKVLEEAYTVGKQRPDDFGDVDVEPLWKLVEEVIPGRIIPEAADATDDEMVMLLAQLRRQVGE